MKSSIHKNLFLFVVLSLSIAALGGCLAEGPLGGPASPGMGFGATEPEGGILTDADSPDDYDGFDAASPGNEAGLPPVNDVGGPSPNAEGMGYGLEGLGGAEAQGSSTNNSYASTEAPPQATQTGAGGDPEGKLKPTCDHPPCFFPDAVNMEQVERPLNLEQIKVPMNPAEIPAGEIPHTRF